MKKLSLLSALLLLLGLPVMAEDPQEPYVPDGSISVGTNGTVELMQGTSTMLEVMFHLPENHSYVSYQFTVNLPEGISFVTKTVASATVIPAELGDGQDPLLFNQFSLNATSHIVTCASNPSTPIGGSEEPLTEGVLVRIPIQADASIPAGTELTGTLSDVIFATIASKSCPFEDATFTVKVTKFRTILDELSAIAPVSEENADVLVKRTIKANEWSTICLPFAMSEEQISTAFGNDTEIEIADFTSWSSVLEYNDEEEDDVVVGLQLGFTQVTEMEANHPYIIKLSNEISEFIADGVNIIAVDESVVEVGKRKKEKGYFYGTKVANTTVPKDNLFLTENKFWYSNGNTKIKAFRGYFELYDDLYDKDVASSRILLTFGDGETTGLRNIQVVGENDGWYTISGQKLDKKPTMKGVYIHGGQKVIIKADRRN